MIPRARCRAGLLLGLVAFAAQGCKLPSSQSDQVRATLSLSKAGPLVIHEKDTLEVVALDAEGRQIADPRIAWWFSEPVDVLQETGPRAVVVGLRPGALSVKAALDDPRFLADPLDTSIAVAYGPMTVSFVGVSRDTLLTSRGGFTLKARAVDRTGAWVPDGQFVWTTARGLIGSSSAADSMLHMSATGIGADTVYLTHTLCPNVCGDTLAVSVEPIPTGIDLDSSLRVTSLHDTIRLAGALQPVVHDSAGYDVPSARITWGLADPGDSTILELLDPSTGVAVTRSEGTARVAAISGSLQAGSDVDVVQLPREAYLMAPSYVVGVGTPFSASYTAADSMGTPIPLSISLNSLWGISPVGVDVSVLHPLAGARDTTLTTPGYGDFVIYLGVWRCVASIPSSCFASWYPRGNLHVIHQPDSVRAYPQNGSPTLNGIGTTATWLGDIYLPDSTITAVPLIWTSLDSAVATIDADGLVTAVSAGTARLVGSMGSVADTSAVTVVGSGP